MKERSVILTSIPAHLKGDREKVIEMAKSQEEYISQKEDCFAAIYEKIEFLDENRCRIYYKLVHTEDW
ncbi:hypothetical protein [Sphingobacterium siyangense]|uniref:hypothetical protein n=1 Tax=Sphingobacterium siyangense TaxID=459529 RepID=UPI003C71DFC1